jgi:endothelin-converting enzyme/putative endopeptidase
MIHNIIWLTKIVFQLTWMSAETKAETIEVKITIKIGYPDEWKDYSKLEIKSVADGGSYFENVKNLSRWSFQKRHR